MPTKIGASVNVMGASLPAAPTVVQCMYRMASIELIYASTPGTAAHPPSAAHLQVGHRQPQLHPGGGGAGAHTAGRDPSDAGAHQVGGASADQPLASLS